MSSLIAGATGYLVDLDGTLLSGQQLLPDAQWLLEAVAGKFMLVSNDSEHTPNQLAQRLRRLGLAVKPEQIILAGTAALDLLARETPGARLLLLGSPSLKTYARQLGLRMAGADAEIVLVTRDRRFTYAGLAMAAEALSRGAKLIVACPDFSHPGPLGEPVPEAGAIAASGVTHHRTVGKPEPLLFETACARLAISPRHAVMIGDNAQTDGIGARRLGMRFVLVRNGNIRLSLADDLQLET